MGCRWTLQHAMRLHETHAGLLALSDDNFARATHQLTMRACDCCGRKPLLRSYLLDAKPDVASQPILAASTTPTGTATEPPELVQRASTNKGLPLCIPIGLIDEDPSNPRTEFPDTEIDELADDVRQRGILQPLVVHPADAQGRYCLHFGAKQSCIPKACAR